MAIIIQVMGGVVQAVYNDPDVEGAYVLLDYDDDNYEDEDIMKYEWEGTESQVMAKVIDDFDEIDPETEYVLKEIKERQ